MFWTILLVYPTYYIIITQLFCTTAAIPVPRVVNVYCSMIHSFKFQLQEKAFLMQIYICTFPKIKIRIIKIKFLPTVPWIFLLHAILWKKFHVEGYGFSSEVGSILFTINYTHGIVAECYLHINILVKQPCILLNKLDLTKHKYTCIQLP